MKKLDAQAAQDVLTAAHDAWNEGDIERCLAQYADDLTYWCNAGSLDGVPYVIEGKQSYRTFLMSITAVADSEARLERFQFEDGVLRGQIKASIRHRRTGLVLAGSYRMIATYRGRKIARIEEYHDAAKMAAFWRMVTSDDEDKDQDPES